MAMLLVVYDDVEMRNNDDASFVRLRNGVLLLLVATNVTAAARNDVLLLPLRNNDGYIATTT
jgi:hypothetical protein